MAKRLRVLIVEDDGMIAFLLGEILKSMGHEVCANEATEDEAIAAAFRYRPDLMIVDEDLGQGSGVAVVDAVLRAGPIPYIFVSGDATRVHKLRPNAKVLEKPYFEDELTRAIQQVMAQDLASPIHVSEFPAGSAAPKTGDGSALLRSTLTEIHADFGVLCRVKTIE